MKIRCIEVGDHDMIYYRGWRLNWEYDLDNCIEWKAWVEGDKLRSSKLTRLLEMIDREEELQ